MTQPDAFDAPTAFDVLTDELDYAMFIVTAASGARRGGCLVGFSTQCSMDPLRYLVCLSRLNHTTAVASDAAVLAVHVVTAGARDLAKLFGTNCGEDVDKFEQCEWTLGTEGVPLLTGCPDRFIGRIRSQHDLGDHIGFVLDVGEVSSGAPGPPLTFQQLRDLRPGHPA
ncbi:MAG: flavin reductase family protein [Actinomycetota bacterium]|nr:flavin reductase family protein [Actinomycetota bacterium]